jgi:AraC-like DNA-binding protein
MTINNETRSYDKGDVIFISDGVLHGGIPHDCVYECIVFDLAFLLKDNHACAKTIQKIMAHQLQIHTHLSQNSPSIQPVVEELSAALSSRKTGYEFLTQGYLYQLLGIILNEQLYEENVHDQVSAERLKSIKNVLAYIADNYSNNITLDTLARIAGMNPKYFCRYFRSITERTPIDYLNYYRIECACEMLITKNISIKETAISCGFNDESYFIKTFHKYKGITPKQYTTAQF